MRSLNVPMTPDWAGEAGNFVVYDPMLSCSRGVPYIGRDRLVHWSDDEKE